MESQQYSGQIVDVVNSRIYSGTVIVSHGHIQQIIEEAVESNQFILPGFIDAHIHIESSMLPPSEFARAACRFGTVAVVADPHEIANVMGMDGIHYMLADAENTPFKFYFSAPSCVPATPFETCGAVLGPAEIEKLLSDSRIHFLGEMMNYPGVLVDEPFVLDKLQIAHRSGKPVDGHAPGLTGLDLHKYIAAGITTDHECSTLEEAREKADHGMKILIREGSAARNLDTLIPLAAEYPGKCMLCSDDLHPDDLAVGHINILVRRAIQHGIDLMDVLRLACVHPVNHYQLDVGQLHAGEPADFIVTENLSEFDQFTTVIGGNVIAVNGSPLLEHSPPAVINNFNAQYTTPEDFHVESASGQLRVILAEDGQLTTTEVLVDPVISNGRIIPDMASDVLKLTVVNRYEAQPPAVAFVRGFGLKEGAIASSISHDSHNIIAVGTNNEDLSSAINLIIEQKGGISAVCRSHDLESILPLPIAGLLSNLSYSDTAQAYTNLDQMARDIGSELRAPFMTLSFMALLVIPELKLSDKGLFNSSTFTFTEITTE